MKFTLTRPQQPRNPMVAPALFRQAGRHQAVESAKRQHAQRALLLELRQRSLPDTHSP